MNRNIKENRGRGGGKGRKLEEEPTVVFRLYFLCPSSRRRHSRSLPTFDCAVLHFLAFESLLASFFPLPPLSFLILIFRSERNDKDFV